MTELALIPIAFFTSCLAATVGMGGGIMLIALMPGLLPASAILPIHAMTQLASNGSRAMFGWHHMDMRLIPAFATGAIAGAWLGGEVYSSLDLRWLPGLIGMVILLVTWVPIPRMGGRGQMALLLLGFYQTGLGMLAGATGPLGAAVLLQRNKERDWLVINTALYMSLNHLLRIVVFALLGFSFYPWLELIAAMIIAVTLGSWAGTWVRSRIPQTNFLLLFKLLVTLLALRMIGLAVLGLR